MTDILILKMVYKSIFVVLIELNSLAVIVTQDFIWKSFVRITPSSDCPILL